MVQLFPRIFRSRGIHRKIELSIFLSKLTLSPGVKIPKREHPQFSLPIFLSSLELSWLSKGNSKQKNCRRLLGWISSLHRMPIYRHSLKKQTRALAMIYGKKKKVSPIVEDQPITNYDIKLCLQLWKTNPPQIMALSFVSNCGRPTHHGNGPQHVALLCKNKKEGGSVRASPVAASMPKSVSF